MELSIARERCQGAGMCVLTAPEVFDQSEADGRVVLVETTPPVERQAAVHEAAELCPAGAITVHGPRGHSGPSPV
ncbi:ferredoxin [Streptomyces sp. NBC_01353]|uniref:ferredoxin n=1 Tax=Streptomyces sp. NBC_01353 TaxID=2903835 RepID=UPI002E3588AA|nr:ferredoxin [Streptomyces sp. NBC_01353]